MRRIFAGEAVRSHAEIEARARSAASGLVASGMRAGDAVALLLHNDFAWFETWQAAALAGAAAVALDRHLPADDLLFILGDCAARVLVAHIDLLPPLRDRLPPGLLVIAVPTPDFVAPEQDGATGGEPTWDAWLAAYAPLTCEPPAAALSLSYTSGSSGRPKGVRRTASRAGSAKAWRVYGFDQPGPAVALVTGPLSHTVPRAFARLAQGAGADLVLMPRFQAEAALALIARYRVSHVHLTPAMMVRMLRLPEAVRRRYDIGSLRHVVHGAAPCAPAIKAEAIAAWGPIVHEYYGSTETGLLTLADSADASRRPGTVGRALPGITLAVLHADGTFVPSGAAGTIYAGSASLHDFTYLGREGDRVAVGCGDLVTAGDIGHLDAEGYLFLHDRGRDLIRVGDAVIVPAEIEAAILGMAGVADCAVLGMPAAAADNESGGTIACACVVLLPGIELTPEMIRSALAQRAPERIEIVADLPRADTGKIFKHVLRERLGRALYARAQKANPVLFDDEA